MEKIGKLLKIHSILIIGVICFLDLLAAQAEPCISAIFRASSDSNVGCQQAGPNLHFAHVNGSPVSFNYVAGSTVLYYDHQIESKSLGCFSQSLLEVGNNLFSINYVYGDSRSTPRVTGSASAQFILNPGATFQQLLCSATFANGSHNGYSCQTQVHLSLSEIDPVLASDIERLKNETTRQLIELRSIDELRPELDALRDLLAEIGSRDFDSLTSDEVLAISQELQESAELIRGFKIEIEQLRVQLFEELSDLRTYFEDIRQVVSNDLRAQGIHPDHQELYQNPSLEDLVFSETELGTVKSQSDTLNSEHNLYKTL